METIIWTRKSLFYGNIRHLAKIIPFLWKQSSSDQDNSRFYGNSHLDKKIRHLAKIIPFLWKQSSGQKNPRFYGNNRHLDKKIRFMETFVIWPR